MIGQAVSGATVTASQGGTVVRQTTSAADGSYQLQLSLGTYGCGGQDQLRHRLGRGNAG